MNILEALSALDPNNNDDWTKDGLPKTEAVSEVVGEAVTRAQITKAAPQFSRTNSVLEVVDVTPETPAEPGTDPDEASDDGDDEDEASDDDDDEDEVSDDDGDEDEVSDDDGDEDEVSDDGDDEDEASDDDGVLEGRLGKDHPEVRKTGRKLEKATQRVKKAQEAFKAASKDHEAAVKKHAPLTHTPEENQRGIMRIIEAGMKRKEAKFASDKATDAALKSIANPIDTVNAKKPDNGRGNAHTQRLNGQGNQ